MNLNASHLDRLVTLVLITTIRGATGSAKPSRTTIENVPAQYAPVSGHEQIRTGALMNDFSARFRFRYRTDIKAKDELLFEGRIFDVVGPVVEIGRRDFIEVLAKARNVS